MHTLIHPGGDRLDLHRLLERCRRNDQDAWKLLVDHFGSLVYSVARRHSLSDDDSADVFQATFQSLYKNLDRIDSAPSLPKWLSVTAANFSLRTIRSSKKNVSLSQDDGSLSDLLAFEEASAEAESARASESYQLRKAVRAMGGRCSSIIEALYLDEEGSYEKAAQDLGIPIGSLGPTRTRCLQKLKKILEEQGFFE